jgi:hypothetical protein
MYVNFSFLSSHPHPRPSTNSSYEEWEKQNKVEKVCLMQDRLKTISIRFDNQEIDVQEYLQGLSFFVAKNVKNKN